jgi:hypothetical protein
VFLAIAALGADKEDLLKDVKPIVGTDISL